MKRFVTIRRSIVTAWLFLTVAAQLPVLLAQSDERAPAEFPTAAEIVERYFNEDEVERLDKTNDTFKAGRPETVVTGIAVSNTATVDVLREAAKRKLNLVIAHEPTFFSGRDDTSRLEGDPVLEAKRALIAEHGLVVWRNHDHWHRRRKDGIIEGVVKSLGWEDKVVKRALEMDQVYRLPERLGLLAKELAETLHANRVRIVGDPDLVTGKVGLAVGAPPSLAHIALLQRDDVEVLVAGESREWETVEYVRDAQALGMRKALILLGHTASEEEGMRHFAEWLAKRVPEVPVSFIPSGDPFSGPDEKDD